MYVLNVYLSVLHCIVCIIISLTDEVVNSLFSWHLSLGTFSGIFRACFLGALCTVGKYMGSVNSGTSILVLGPGGTVTSLLLDIVIGEGLLHQ